VASCRRRPISALGIRGVDRFFCGIWNASKVRPHDQVEQRLLDRGHPTLTKFCSTPFKVEVYEVPPYEVNFSFSIGELQCASVMLDGDDGDVEGSRNGGVDPRSAHSHECCEAGMAAGGGNG
jgi:hypothetical protein